mmetsp:Transcript_34287/g.67503  ORF Transcript_34287/g.67503 Transcript_34287/m.67503 type:complete len:184 (+) Transcript_34287:40-591(+)
MLFASLLLIVGVVLISPSVVFIASLSLLLVSPTCVCSRYVCRRSFFVKIVKESGPATKSSAVTDTASAKSLDAHVEQTFVPKPDLSAIKEKLKGMTPKARLLFLRKFHEEKAQEKKNAAAKAAGLPVPVRAENIKDLYGGSLKPKPSGELDGEALDEEPATKKAKSSSIGPIGPAGPPTKPAE